MKKKLPIAVVIFLVSLLLLLPAAQTLEQQVAQLEKKLAASSGIEKVDILNQIARACIYLSGKKCIDTGMQAIALAKEVNYPKGEATAYNNTAIGHAVSGNNTKSLEYFDLAKQKFQDTGDLSGVARVLNNIGNIYRRTGEPQKCLPYFEEALSIHRDRGEKRYIATVLGNIGNVYSALSFPEDALKYFFESLKINEEIKNQQGIAKSYYNIGTQYLELEREEQAMEHFQKALRLSREQGDKIGVTESLLAISTLFTHAENYSSSLDYNRQALALAEETGDTRSLSYALGNIGEIYRKQGQYRKALEYYRRTLDIEKKSNDRIKLAQNLNEIGLCHAQLKEYGEAREHLHNALALAEEMDNKSIIKKSCDNLSSLYDKIGNYKKALEFHKRSYRLHQEIIDESTSRQITEMQTRYETLKKEKENEVLKRENKINQLNLGKTRMTRNAFIAGFALVLAIMALLFRKYLYLFAFWKKEKHIGNFRLMEKLGSGAMGTIYKAHSMARKSDIAAVKVLRDELFNDPGQRTRFKREAAIIDKLDHPNIIKVYEAGSEMDLKKLFIVMEYLEGITLEKKLARDKQPSIEESLHIMAQVAGAIVCIHERKIIHRDLKPGNIMLVEKDGDPNFVKLLDFGLARTQFHTRLTQSGNFVGTIEYVAPEQILDALSVPANDIFSMGVIFYRLLTGRTPFQGASVVEVMRQLITVEPPPVSQLIQNINETLDRLVMQMIEKLPAERPTAAEVSQILASIRQ